MGTLNREVLLLELENLKSLSRSTFEEMEKQRLICQKYLGAIEAVQSLLATFFPECEPSNTALISDPVFDESK